MAVLTSPSSIVGALAAAARVLHTDRGLAGRKALIKPISSIRASSSICPLKLGMMLSKPATTLLPGYRIDSRK